VGFAKNLPYLRFHSRWYHVIRALVLNRTSSIQPQELTPVLLHCRELVGCLTRRPASEKFSDNQSRPNMAAPVQERISVPIDDPNADTEW
jgi:hypothetical protein